MKRENWKWFGHAGHFICGHRCHFHLTTLVGKYLVSTVGEMPKDNRLPEDGGPWHEIGLSRTYETMVFEAGKPCAHKGCGCGLPEISGQELDFLPYRDAASATAGHLKLCKKWSAK